MSTGAALDAEVGRAGSLIRLGRHADAEAMLRRVLATDPDHYDALANLAWLLYCVDRVDECADAALRLVALDPHHVEGHLRLARARYRQDREEEAEPAARIAVELSPDDPDTWSVLARVLARLPEREDEAMAAADEAVHLNPHVAAGHGARAMVLVALRRWEDAEAALADALAHEPQSPEYLLQIALVRLRLGNAEDARTDFLTGLRLSPAPSTVHDVIRLIGVNGVAEPLAEAYAMACDAVGEPDLSIPGTAGTDPDLLTRQANLARNMWQAAAYGHPWAAAGRRRARELVAAVLAAEPDNREGRDIAAHIADELEDHETALDLALSLLRDGYTDRPRPFRIASESLLDLGRPEDSLTLADSGLEEHPQDVDLVLRRAKALFALEEYAQALGAVAHARELAPRNPSPLIELARIQRLLEAPDDAKASLEAALELAPDHAPARLSYGSLFLMSYQDYATAERELVKVDMPFNDGGVLGLLAQARFMQGKWTQALTDYEAALAAPERVTTGVPELVVDSMRRFGGPGPFRQLYVRCLDETGTQDGEPADADTHAGLGAYLLKQAALRHDDPEALAWAGVMAREALSLDPEHGLAKAVWSITSDPTSDDARETLASLRGEPEGDDD